MNMQISRRAVFFVTLIILALAIFVDISDILCTGDFPCTYVREDIGSFIPIILVLFLLSVAAFFFSDFFYNLWIKYSYVALPIAVVLILLSSSATGGFLFPSDRAIAGIGVPVLYLFFFSLIAFVAFLRRNGKLKR
jgi:hypothetical protein